MPILRMDNPHRKSIFVNKTEERNEGRGGRDALLHALAIDGHLGREFPMPPRWYAREPQLSKDESLLLFGPFFNEGPDLERPGTVRELLDRFIDLVDGSVSDIFTFARKWGSLNLCRHGLPSAHSAASPMERQEIAFAQRDLVEERLKAIRTHDSRNSIEAARLRKLFDQLTEFGHEVHPPKAACPLFVVKDARDKNGCLLMASHAERVESWRSIASEFRAILRSAATLHSQQVPPRTHWPRYRLGPGLHVRLLRRLEDADPYPDVFGDTTKVVIRNMRFALGVLIDRWLRWCPLQFRYSWDDVAPGMYLGPTHETAFTINRNQTSDFYRPLLLPMLAFQLSAAVYGALPARFCEVCGRQLLPSGRAGRPRVTCRRTACKRESDRRRKEKQLQKNRR